MLRKLTVICTGRRQYRVFEIHGADWRLHQTYCSLGRAKHFVQRVAAGQKILPPVWRWGG